MIKKEKEMRLYSTDFECRDSESDNKMIIEGYAVVFESPATHYGYTEVIDKNAFNGSDMRDVVLRYNHNDSFLILARTRNNSLQLTVDDKGLYIRAELINTTNNEDIYKSVKAKLLDKMSFCFTVESEENDYETDTRRILKFDKIFDVSIVDVPFYDSTEVYARNLKNSESRFFKGKKEYNQIKLEKEKLELMIKCI